MSSSIVMLLTMWSIGFAESGTDVATAGTVDASSIPAPRAVATPARAPAVLVDNVPPGGVSRHRSRARPLARQLFSRIHALGKDLPPSPYARPWPGSPPGLDQGRRSRVRRRRG